MADERTVAWDIKRLYLASYTNGVFGTARRAKGGVSGQIAARVKSGEQPGDGGIYAVVAKLIAATITLSFADMEAFENFATLFGTDSESSGTEDIAMALVAKVFPYIAMLAVTDLDDGVGEFHLFVPQWKITSDYNIAVADNAFVLPEFQGTAVPSSYYTRNENDVVGFLIRYAVAVTAAIPPVALVQTI